MYTSKQRKWILSHLQNQPDSGITVKDYCKLHQLNRSVFYRWRSEFSEELSKQTEGSELTSSSSCSTFIPLVIEGTSPMVEDCQEDLRMIHLSFRFSSGVEATASMSIGQIAALIGSQSLCSH